MYCSDYLVVGSGIAGLSFALKAAGKGSVIIITKKSAAESNTRFAQGGIACVSDPADDVDSHIHDTLNAGAGHCNEAAVRLMVEEAGHCIEDLLRIGVDFDRDAGGFDLHREGGHSSRRILHHRDMTGSEIERKLLEAVRRNPSIRILENSMALDLICNEDKQGGKICRGVYVLEPDGKHISAYTARYTVICSGGAGQVYRFTTNPAVATGDGIAMAWRAGAETTDMEFMQFHPTSILTENGQCLLVTEALRGEGAQLINSDGEEFMRNYHPMGSMAPRDIVSRAIVAEMQKSQQHAVFLSLKNISGFTKKFPAALRNCIQARIDPTSDLVPVVPAAHYLCGGIKTDLHGRSSIGNLYAFGEAACTGVHGANRLASNSLLEALVFSKRAFLDTEIKHRTVFSKEPYCRSANTGEAPDDKVIAALRTLLRHLMWKKAGIVRNTYELNGGLKELKSIREHASLIFHACRKSVASAELQNLSAVAQLILESALSRKKSIGLHYIR